MTVASHTTIVIVGGGFAGVCTLHHLLARLDATGKQHVRIHLFEQSDELGPGLAWTGTNTSDCQLCNLPVGGLSFSPTFSPSFQEWIKGKYPDTVGGHPSLAASYPPRKYFGEYLTEMLQKIEKENSNFVTVHARTEVIAVVPTSNSTFKIKVRKAAPPDGNVGNSTLSTEFEAHKVALCLGSPGGTGGNFRFNFNDNKNAAARYVATPWPYTNLDNFQTPKKIAIIGSGLTAIDVVKHVSRRYPDATLIMASRQGRINCVAPDWTRVSSKPYTRKVLTDEVIEKLPNPTPLADLVGMVKAELIECMKEHKHTEDDLPWDALFADDVDGVAELQRHATNHENGKHCRWLFCMWSIDDIFPQLWQKLSKSDKTKWLSSKERTVYQNHTNPFPIESARELLKLFGNGKMVLRNKLKDVKPAEDGGSFTLHFDAEGDKAALDDVSYIINCTGVAFDITKADSPLLQQMLQDGVGVANEFGGVELDPATLRVKNKQGEATNVWAVGHLAKGTRWVTSGAGFLKAMVGIVSADMA